MRCSSGAKIRVLGYPTFGARHLLNTKRRVIKPDDLKGLKIRAPDPLLEATWRALGANPTPLPFPEVFNALQQGVIDGDANPLTSIQTFRWYESVKYVSYTNTAVGIGVFIINEPFFQKLPKAQQDVILKAAAESIKANRASEADLNAKAEAFLKTQGVNFDTPEPGGIPRAPDTRVRRGEEALRRRICSIASPRRRRVAERRARHPRRAASMTVGPPRAAARRVSRSCRLWTMPRSTSAWRCWSCSASCSPRR